MLMLHAYAAAPPLLLFLNSSLPQRKRVRVLRNRGAFSRDSGALQLHHQRVEQPRLHLHGERGSMHRTDTRGTALSAFLMQLLTLRVRRGWHRPFVCT